MRFDDVNIDFDIGIIESYIEKVQINIGANIVVH